jgi:hypothetical protein
VRNSEVCNRKVAYDTAFEAERKAAITEHRFGEEMEAYACGNHYHLTHKKRAERGKHELPKTYCEACDSHMRLSHYRTHITRIGHLNKVRKAQHESIIPGH